MPAENGGPQHYIEAEVEPTQADSSVVGQAAIAATEQIQNPNLSTKVKAALASGLFLIVSPFLLHDKNVPATAHAQDLGPAPIVYHLEDATPASEQTATATPTRPTVFLPIGFRGGRGESPSTAVPTATATTEPTEPIPTTTPTVEPSPSATAVPPTPTAVPTLGIGEQLDLAQRTVIMDETSAGPNVILSSGGYHSGMPDYQVPPFPHINVIPGGSHDALDVATGVNLRVEAVPIGEPGYKAQSYFSEIDPKFIIQSTIGAADVRSYTVDGNTTDGSIVGSTGVFFDHQDGMWKFNNGGSEANEWTTDPAENICDDPEEEPAALHNPHAEIILGARIEAGDLVQYAKVTEIDTNTGEKAACEVVQVFPVDGSLPDAARVEFASWANNAGFKVEKIEALSDPSYIPEGMIEEKSTLENDGLPYIAIREPALRDRDYGTANGFFSDPRALDFLRDGYARGVIVDSAEGWKYGTASSPTGLGATDLYTVVLGELNRQGADLDIIALSLLDGEGNQRTRDLAYAWMEEEGKSGGDEKLKAAYIAEIREIARASTPALLDRWGSIPNVTPLLIRNVSDGDPNSRSPINGPWSLAFDYYGRYKPLFQDVFDRAEQQARLRNYDGRFYMAEEGLLWGGDEGTMANLAKNIRTARTEVGDRLGMMMMENDLPGSEIANWQDKVKQGVGFNIGGENMLVLKGASGGSPEDIIAKMREVARIVRENGGLLGIPGSSRQGQSAVDMALGILP